MNSFKGFLGAAILTLSLSLPVCAGEVQTPTKNSSADETGETIATAEQGTSDIQNDLMLGLMLGMLSLY